MPEMRFRIRWPDGRSESCYSPSLVVKDYFAPGESYSLDDFVARSRTALAIAGERVKVKYGHLCPLAAAQLARIEDTASVFSDMPSARVMVDSFEE
jgi:uncharacterized repeat protein (TIGR04042 family)